MEYSSLCYTAGPCCLSILHTKLTSGNPSLPIHLFSPIPSPLATASLSSVFMILFLFRKYIHLGPVLDSACKWYHMIFVFFWLHLVW